MTTVTGDSVTAVDLTRVVMLSSSHKNKLKQGDNIVAEGLSKVRPREKIKPKLK